MSVKLVLSTGSVTCSRRFIPLATRYLLLRPSATYYDVYGERALGNCIYLLQIDHCKFFQAHANFILNFYSDIFASFISFFLLLYSAFLNVLTTSKEEQEPNQPF